MIVPAQINLSALPLHTVCSTASTDYPCFTFHCVWLRSPGLDQTRRNSWQRSVIVYIIFVGRYLVSFLLAVLLPVNRCGFHKIPLHLLHLFFSYSCQISFFHDTFAPVIRRPSENNSPSKVYAKKIQNVSIIKYESFWNNEASSWKFTPPSFWGFFFFES